MDSVASMRCLLEDMLLDKNAEPTDLPISVLKAITKDFSNDLQIGKGGFAVVYKGMLGNGRIVAIKKLSNSIDMDENKYNQEVGCLMRVRHKNIVRFLGYCADTQGKMCDYGGKFVMADVRQRLLCFEYLSKGSLEQYITDAFGGLKWSKRYLIIKGICEGLHYLHANRIVHLDLKPANILLDDNMVPKIADFGLSRCFDENQTRAITSKLVGSMGYLAPEFFRGVITLKLDIYSLGVIILEILTGEKGYSTVESVLESWRNTLNISSGETVLEQVRVCTQIAIECIDPNPAKRPVTVQIIEMLDKTESKDKFIQTDMCTASEYIQTDMSTTSTIQTSACSSVTGEVVDKLKSLVVYEAQSQAPCPVPVTSEEVSLVEPQSSEESRAEGQPKSQGPSASERAQFLFDPGTTMMSGPAANASIQPQSVNGHSVSEDLGGVPSFFICPILQDVMTDPLIAADGFTYEAKAIREWLDIGHRTSPMTNLELSHRDLLPNHALRFAIQEWLQTNAE